MKVVESSGRTEKEALDKALIMCNANEQEVIYKIERINSSEIKVTATTKRELLDDIKDFVKKLLEELGLKIEIESHLQNDIYELKMYSNNNPILIGKNGQTLKALETIVRQKYLIEWNQYIKLNFDVEDYKEKRIKYLEQLAIKTAKEVQMSKIDVTLENMNAFERRIIHNTLTNYPEIFTKSEGGFFFCNIFSEFKNNSK